MTQFMDQARIIFSQLRPSRRKFLFLKILFFSLLFQNLKSLPRKTMEIRPFTILAFSSVLFIHIFFLLLFFILRYNFYEAQLQNGATWKVGTASKCLIRWSPVHCHYDKRSKGIISAIGSLEKPLILPNLAKICTFNFHV